MTTVTVSLRTAIRIARGKKKAIPRWKRWRLKNPEKDKAQKRAYYRRNRDKIAVKRRILKLGRTGANAGDL